MNQDPFEKKLVEFSRSFRRHDPTKAWKSEILARACAEAQNAPFTKGSPPKWLLLSWAAAWALITLLQLGTSSAQRGQESLVKYSGSGVPGGVLLAFHKNYNIDLQ